MRKVKNSTRVALERLHFQLREAAGKRDEEAAYSVLYQIHDLLDSTPIKGKYQDNNDMMEDFAVIDHDINYMIRRAANDIPRYMLTR